MILKDNIKYLIIDKLREDYKADFDRNVDFVAEYIRDNIGIGPQKKNPNSRYKIDAIKQNLNVNPSQPPSIRFLLGLCELFKLSLDDLFTSNESHPMEANSHHNLHNRYHKYLHNNTKFYIYFLDTKKGIDIEEGIIEFIRQEGDGLTTNLTLTSYNKSFTGQFKINSNNPIGQIDFNAEDVSKDESIKIMLVDPSVESTELIGAVGFMLSQSADSIKKPCLNKVILSKKRIVQNNFESRKWLQGLLNITPNGLLINKVKYEEILENKEVDKHLKAFINAECQEHIFIDDPALWHKRMPEDILDKKDDLHELMSLLRHVSVSDRIFKLTEIENTLVYEFLKPYN